MIFCKKTNTSYYGHSDNVLYRLGRHFNDLEAGCHDNRELQHDWLCYGRDEFDFRPLETGEEWKSKQKRVVRENQYFQAAECLYNKSTSQSGNFRLQVTLEGTSYSSIAEAARKLGISESSASRLIKKSGQIQRVSRAKAIFVRGKKFESLTQAVKVLKISRSQLYRRLRSPKFPDWFYCDTEETRSNDYPAWE